MRLAILTAAAAAIFTLASAAQAADAPAAAPRPLAAQTRANLETAMRGEAFAHLKYGQYAEAARERGREDLARLFEAAAKVEGDEHFAREAGAFGLAGADAANLADAMAGEHYETVTMYRTFAEQAEAAGDVKVAAMFRQIAEDEGDHYAAYKAALDALPRP